MDRRQFVKYSGFIASTGVIAGCSELTGGLEVTGVNASPTAFGNVDMRIQVANDSSSSESGTLAGEVDLDDGDAFTKQREITVQGESSNTFDFSFDIPITDSLSGGQFSYDAWMD